jgi:hypothetical protein
MTDRSEQAPRESAKAGGKERRISVRRPVLETSKRLVAAIGADFCLAKVRNISPEGISLVLARSIEAGTILAVDLIETKTNRFSRTLDVRVCWSVEHPSGDWIIGGAFAGELTAEELDYFLRFDWIAAPGIKMPTAGGK